MLLSSQITERKKICCQLTEELEALHILLFVSRRVRETERVGLLRGAEEVGKKKGLRCSKKSLLSTLVFSFHLLLLSLSLSLSFL